MKKGVSDAVLDYEKVLSALERVIQLTKQTDETLSEMERSVLLFNVMTLLCTEEYSVRDYSLHAIGMLINQITPSIFMACEKWILTQLKLGTNELILKSILSTYKLFIIHAHENQVTQCIAAVDLYPLVKGGNEDDFFSQVLSMQMQ